MITEIATTKSRPAVELAPFGPPPLIEGEDGAAYDELLSRVSTAIKPADILEDIWVREIVDLDWEVLRLRRLKASLMAASAHHGLYTLLESLSFRGNTSALRDGWVTRKPRSTARVKQVLDSAGLTIDAVMAETLRQNLDEIERIERMIANAAARRNSALREIELHRTTVAYRRQHTMRQVENAEYQDAESVESKSAA
jgi:hypothetical protein